MPNCNLSQLAQMSCWNPKNDKHDAAHSWGPNRYSASELLLKIWPNYSLKNDKWYACLQNRLSDKEALYNIWNWYETIYMLT